MPDAYTVYMYMLRSCVQQNKQQTHAQRVCCQFDESQRHSDRKPSAVDVQVFDGNTADDKDDGKLIDLPYRVYAQTVRIVPLAWNGNISLRFDVYGCVFGQSGEIVVINPNCGESIQLIL